MNKTGGVILGCLLVIGAGILFIGRTLSPTNVHPLGPGAPSPGQIQSAFADKPRIAVDQGTPALDVFIDNSQSIGGFSEDVNSLYRVVIGRLLRYSLEARRRPAFYAFSEALSIENSFTGARALSQEFYRGSGAVFGQPLGHIAAQSGTGIAAVISDMAQPDNDHGSNSLATALESIARQKREVTLLAYRSAFRGPYWAKGRPTPRRLHLDLDGFSPENGRSFYILVIGSSKENAAYFKGNVLLGLAASEEFHVSEPGTVLKPLFRPDLSSEQGQAWIKYGEEEFPDDGPMGSSRRIFSFVEDEPHASTGGPPPLEVRFKANSSSQIGPRSSLRFQIERRSFSAKGWGPREDIDERPSVQWDDSDESPWVVSFQFRRPKSNTWDAYRIRIRPSNGDLRLPGWVADWSTFDDAAEGQGARTLGLDALVGLMIGSIQEEVAIADCFILLSGPKKDPKVADISERRLGQVETVNSGVFERH